MKEEERINSTHATAVFTPWISQHGKKKTMNAFPKNIATIALVLASVTLGFGAHAQTRQLIKPADATSGTAFAGPSISIPALPSDLCTNSNGLCVTAATLPGYVEPLISNQVATGATCEYLDQWGGPLYWPTRFAEDKLVYIRIDYGFSSSASDDRRYLMQCRNGVWVQQLM